MKLAIISMPHAVDDAFQKSLHCLIATGRYAVGPGLMYGLLQHNVGFS